MNDMILFGDMTEAQLPAHLQGQGLGVGTALMAAIGDMRNRIGLKGNRFRQIVQGQEVGVFDENYLDVIIVGVVPSLSRLFYKDKYKNSGDNSPPTCYSVDNVTPADDVKQKQNPICGTCQQNVKGSAFTEDGYATKACGYFRRLVVMLPGDVSLYTLDVKSMGLFGESQKERGLFNLNEYAKFLNNNGVDASVLITRLSFDTEQSVPKLMFKALCYISESEVIDVKQVSEGGQIEEYLLINMKTVDLSGEQVLTDETGDDVEAEQPEIQQAPVRQAPPAQTAPTTRQAAPTRPATTAPAQTAPARQPAPAQRQTAPVQRQQAPRQTAPRQQAQPVQEQAQTQDVQQQQQQAPVQQQQPRQQGQPVQQAPRQTAPVQRQQAPRQTAQPQTAQSQQRQTAPVQRQQAPRQAAPQQRQAAPPVNRPAPRQAVQIDDNVQQDDMLPIEVGDETEMQSILADLGL